MLDTGHGRVDANGFYTTCPSPVKTDPNTWKKCMFNGDDWIYEGEWNDIIGTELAWIIHDNPEELIDFEVVTHNAADMPLSERVAIFNDSDCDIFVSLHFDYWKDSNVKGTSVFVHTKASESSKFAGETFAKGLMLDIPSEPLRRESNDYKYKTADFKVLRETKGPAVLIELGFFSNPDTQRMMKYQSHREMLASSLFESLKKIRDGIPR